MIPDLVNGGIEFTGGLLLLLHSRQVLKDREVKGVSVPPMLFFLAWGFWNLFYYPHLGQWWSFAGGCFVVAANALWVALVLYYKGLRWPRSIRRAWWVAHFLSCCSWSESEYLGPHGRNYGPVLRRCKRCGRTYVDVR